MFLLFLGAEKWAYAITPITPPPASPAPSGVLSWVLRSGPLQAPLSPHSLLARPSEVLFLGAEWASASTPIASPLLVSPSGVLSCSTRNQTLGVLAGRKGLGLDQY